jgi:hypothetical protein
VTGAEIKAAEQIASSNYVFAILFILCLFVMGHYMRQVINDSREERKQARQDAHDREKALLVIIERQNESLEKINDTQDKIQLRIEKLEDRFDTAIDLRNRNFQELKIGRADAQ